MSQLLSPRLTSIYGRNRHPSKKVTKNFEITRTAVSTVKTLFLLSSNTSNHSPTYISVLTPGLVNSAILAKSTTDGNAACSRGVARTVLPPEHAGPLLHSVADIPFVASTTVEYAHVSLRAAAYATRESADAPRWSILNDINTFDADLSVHVLNMWTFSTAYRNKTSVFLPQRLLSVQWMRTYSSHNLPSTVTPSPQRVSSPVAARYELGRFFPCLMTLKCYAPF